MTLTEQIAAVLAEHGGRGARYCACGEPAVLRPGPLGKHKGFITWHRAHVAAHLAPLVRQAQAEAWAEISDADDLDALPVASVVGDESGERWFKADGAWYCQHTSPSATSPSWSADEVMDDATGSVRVLYRADRIEAEA